MIRIVFFLISDHGNSLIVLTNSKLWLKLFWDKTSKEIELRNLETATNGSAE